MPGTTRYSATFDRTYEEEDRVPPAEPPAQRRSRSQSWQAPSLTNGRQYSPFGYNAQRSSSQDNGQPKGAEQIPTRTVGKAAVKAHSNPFQFVKVGTCPLYKKAEEQLKKAKEVKKPDVLKEEEEEWQSNLDSWKSRRRKMSEEVFRRQEEIRQFEIDEQISQLSQKKTKTFNEMLESRAFRGRTLSLCLISSPLEFQDWDSENIFNTNGKNSHSSDESEENSTVNSEDEHDNCTENIHKNSSRLNSKPHNKSKNGVNDINGISQTNSHTENSNVLNNNNNQETVTQKDGAYVDSGLESISSSQRVGDIADSGSDFSQDSASSSMDGESPRLSALTLNGIHLLDDYATKSQQMNGVEPQLKSIGTEISLKLTLNNGIKDYGLTFNKCKNETQNVVVASVLDGSIAKSCGVLNGDHILAINGKNITSMNHSQITSLLKLSTEQKHMDLLLRRHQSSKDKENPILSSNSTCLSSEEKIAKSESNNKLSNNKSSTKTVKQTKPESVNKSLKTDVKEDLNPERSIESENEMFVDDFEELKKKSASNSSKISVTTKDSNENTKTSGKISSTIPSSSSIPVSNAESHAAPQLNNQNVTPPSKDTQKETDKLVKPLNSSQTPKKKIKIVKKKVISSNQNSNTTSSPKEIIKIYNEPSLNIIFHSSSLSNCSGNKSETSKLEVTKTHTSLSQNDVPSVDKVAEEMEKLILQQLEEEEKAKEMMLSKSNDSSESILTAPPRQVEPPKEKPPPPPKITNDSQKSTSLKRVNSTKRIKKEIHKRRSNFLGIENDDEHVICDDSMVPPPPALKEILKAEMEMDRESRRQLENAAVQRITLEEKELIKKEQEIIKSLENEEREKLLMNGIDGVNNIVDKSPELSIVKEDQRIKVLKEEKRRTQEEQVLNIEQQKRLAEEKSLKEREEFIKKQEDKNSKPAFSPGPISVAENPNNNASKPLPASSLSSATKSNASLSEKGKTGDGKKDSISVSSSSILTNGTTSGSTEKTNVTVKPVVPPKPIKKKEVLRKERERLRQEQEALQREREAHRQKLLQEQEEMKNHPKPHAPVSSRLGPIPFKSAFSSQLTAPSASPIARDNASFTSRSHHGAQNAIPGNIDSVETNQLPSHPPTRQNVKSALSQGKSLQNENWGQQKVPPVRKQNHDSMSESRYNQNHWLIQEAEMRRITELKERQRAAQTNSYSHAHLAEDDVCSASSIVNASQNPNYPVPNVQWNYKQSDQTLKKYLPVMGSEKSYQPLPHPPNKPSRVVPLERQEQMLSVSGRKRCSHCNEELGRGAAMIIESLQLYYHIQCFQCCVCQAQLGNGSCGTDVRVRNNKLHCQNCYSNDEAGLKFSQV